MEILSFMDPLSLSLMAGGALGSMYDMWKNRNRRTSNFLDKGSAPYQEYLKFSNMDSDFYKTGENTIRRTLGDMAPNANDFMTLGATRGMSNAQVLSNIKDSQTRVNEQAATGLNNLKMEGAKFALSPLEMAYKNAQFDANLDLENQNSRLSFYNNLMGLGGGLWSANNMASTMGKAGTEIADAIKTIGLTAANSAVETGTDELVKEVINNNKPTVDLTPMPKESGNKYELVPAHLTFSIPNFNDRPETNHSPGGTFNGAGINHNPNGIVNRHGTGHSPGGTFNGPGQISYTPSFSSRPGISHGPNGTFNRPGQSRIPNEDLLKFKPTLLDSPISYTPTVPYVIPKVLNTNSHVFSSPTRNPMYSLSLSELPKNYFSSEVSPSSPRYKPKEYAPIMFKNKSLLRGMLDKARENAPIMDDDTIMREEIPQWIPDAYTYGFSSKPKSSNFFGDLFSGWNSDIRPRKRRYKW